MELLFQFLDEAHDLINAATFRVERTLGLLWQTVTGLMGLLQRLVPWSSGPEPERVAQRGTA